MIVHNVHLWFLSVSIRAQTFRSANVFVFAVCMLSTHIRSSMVGVMSGKIMSGRGLDLGGLHNTCLQEKRTSWSWW